MRSQSTAPLTVVADLHMSAGPRDNFHEDQAFAEFADDLIDRAAERGGEGTVLVLGDLLDFARVELVGGRRRRLDTSTETSLLKLDAAPRSRSTPPSSSCCRCGGARRASSSPSLQPCAS